MNILVGFIIDNITGSFDFFAAQEHEMDELRKQRALAGDNWDEDQMVIENPTLALFGLGGKGLGDKKKNTKIQEAEVRIEQETEKLKSSENSGRQIAQEDTQALVDDTDKVVGIEEENQLELIDSKEEEEEPQD